MLANDSDESSSYDADADNVRHAESISQKTTALVIAASDKAGMEGIPRERINEIIARESGDSPFMQRAEHLDERHERKIQSLLQRLREKDDQSDNWRVTMCDQIIDPQLERYRSQRHKVSTRLVVDMDSFFISCHILDSPELDDSPCCVGGSKMISTSNYKARRYGVRAALPGYIGSILVKELSGGKEHLTFVKSDFKLYQSKSAEVKLILQEYDRNLKMHSLDEAYMDIESYLGAYFSITEGSRDHAAITERMSNSDGDRPPLHEIAPLSEIRKVTTNLVARIRERVQRETGLTCSAGIASNFMLAKIASDMNKPNGQVFVGPSEGEIKTFVSPLNVRKVCGVGRVLEKSLRATLGVVTVEDLYAKRAEVNFLFKPATAQFLMRVSIGYSEGSRRESEGDEAGDDEAAQRKGMSGERTFQPTATWTDLCMKLESIATCLAKDVQAKGLKPRTIGLKIKLANFTLITKAATRQVALFQEAGDGSTQALVDITVKLLRDVKRTFVEEQKKVNSPPSSFTVRLLGVRCSNFRLERETQSSILQYQKNACDVQSKLGNSSETCEELSSTRQRSPTAVNPYRKSPKRPRLLSHRVSSGGVGDHEKMVLDVPKISRDQHDASLVEIAPPQQPKWACPICQRQLPLDQNDRINSHVDACLSASKVKEVARQETVLADRRAGGKRKRGLDQFFK